RKPGSSRGSRSSASCSSCCSRARTRKKALPRTSKNANPHSAGGDPLKLPERSQEIRRLGVQEFRSYWVFFDSIPPDHPGLLLSCNLLFQGEDAKEALAANLEKRKPPFRGR